MLLTELALLADFAHVSDVKHLEVALFDGLVLSPVFLAYSYDGLSTLLLLLDPLLVQ